MNHGKGRYVLIMPVLLVLAFMHLSLQTLFSAHHLVKSSSSSGAPLTPKSPFSVPFAAPVNSQLSMYEILSSVPFAAPANSQPIAVVQPNKASPHVFQSLVSAPPTPLPDNASLKIVSLQEKKILADLISKELSSVDLSSLDQAGHTLLHSAIHHNHHLIFHYLVPLYAQANLLNLPSKTGETPFALAVKNHNSEFAKSLFDLGAHTNLSDSSGKAPLQSTYEKNCRPLVSLLSDVEKPLSFLPAQIEGLSFSREMSLLQPQRKPGSLSLAESVHYEQVEGTPIDIPAQDQKHTHDALESSPALIPSPNFSPTSASLASSSLLDHRKQNLPGDKEHHNSDTIASNDTKHTHDAVDSVRAFTPPTNFLLAGNAPHDTSINYEKQSIPDDEKHTEEVTSQISDDSKHTADALEISQASGANVDATAVGKKGSNALHTAAKNENDADGETTQSGNELTLEDLLDSSTDIDDTSLTDRDYYRDYFYRDNALQHAAQSGNDTIVQQLIAFFANANRLNDEDHHGSTVLHWAAKKCNTATVKALIDAGADLTKTDENGFTALHYTAQRNGQNMTVQFLIPLFAKAGLLNAQTKDGFTALHWAAEYCDGATIKAFIDAGADINQSNKRGESALHWAAYNRDNAPVKTLLDAGADITKIDIDGSNALHHAALSGNDTIVQFLIPLFAKASLLNAQTETGDTPLIYAAESCNSATVKTLIDAGGDITKTDNDGRNALHRAAQKGRCANIELLLPYFAKGGLLNAKTKSGHTARELARKGWDADHPQALIQAAIDAEAKRPKNISRIPDDSKHTADVLENAHVVTPSPNFSPTSAALVPYQPAEHAKQALAGDKEHSNSDAVVPNDTKHTHDVLASIPAFPPLPNGSHSNHAGTPDQHLDHKKHMEEKAFTLPEDSKHTADDFGNIQASLANVDVTAVNNEGCNALHTAAQRGNNALVQSLIPFFAKAGLLNAQDKYGSTALIKAAAQCDSATVKTLIDAGADITQTDRAGHNALHCAAERGKNITVQLLIPLFTHANLLNAQNRYGTTALINAIEKCDEATVKALVDAGADITRTDNEKFNALHKAAQHGRNTTAHLLTPLFTKAGLLNARTNYGHTALHWAAQRCNEVTVQTLINAGADITQTDIAGFNTLHYTSGKGKNATVQLLAPLFAKASLLNTHSRHGVTALMLAAGYSDVATVKSFLAAGADPLKTDRMGRNALHRAALSGRNANVQFLIPLFAKTGLLNAQTEDGSTALILATRKCDKATIQTLIDAGADITKTDIYDFNALHRAAYAGRNTTVQFLVPLFTKVNLLNAQTKDGYSALSMAAASCDSEIVKTLIHAGADITRTDMYGFNALHRAAYAGRNTTVEFLVPLFTKVNLLNAQTKDGRTALMLAASTRNAATVKTLIDAGADITKNDDCGANALHYTAAAGENANVQPLLSLFTKVGLLNAQGRDGITALMVAAGVSNEATVKNFIEAGANITKTDSDGHNALHLAALNGKNGNVRLLASFFAKAGLLNAQTKKGLTALDLARKKCDSNAVQALINAGGSDGNHLLPTGKEHPNNAASAPNDTKHTHDALQNAQTLTPLPNSSLASAAVILHKSLDLEKQPYAGDKEHHQDNDVVPNDTKHTHDALESARTLMPLPHSSLAGDTLMPYQPAGHGKQPIPEDSKHTADAQDSLANIDVTAVDKEGNNALHIAAESGNDALVLRLIPLFAKAGLLNAQTKHGYTVLHQVAAKCDATTIKALIHAGADLTKTDNDGWNALLYAAGGGKNANVQLLIPSFAKAGLLNAHDKNGITALHCAAQQGSEATVKIFIDAGADITKTDSDGCNALHHAAVTGKNNTVQLLTPYFAKAGLINSQTKDGLTALDIARTWCDSTTVQALINAGASGEEQPLPDDSKHTDDVLKSAPALILSPDASFARMAAMPNQPTDNAKQPIQGNDVVPNDTKHTHDALESARTLTPLPHCSLAGDALIPNQPAGNGEELMPKDSKHTADAQASLANIDVTAVDKEGNNALHIATQKGNDALVQRLIPLFARANLLNAQTINGSTALAWAAAKCNESTVKALIDAGADIKKTNEAGWNALHHAATWPENVNVMRLLLPFFINANLLNAQTRDGSTALIIAALSCNEAAVKVLIDAGADVTKEDDNGYSALHWAAWRGKSATVHLLAPLFAKAGLINAENNYGLTALAIARKKCDISTVQALIKAGASDEEQSLPGNKEHHQGNDSIPNDTKHTHDALESIHAFTPLPNSSLASAAVTSHQSLTLEKQLVPNDSKHTADAQASLPNMDVTAVDKEGYNALHTAANNGNDDLVQRLIPLFARANLLNTQTQQGDTALTWAAAKCDSVTVKALIDAGADINKTTNYGVNALHHAVCFGKNATVQLLLPHFAKAGLLNAQSDFGSTALIWAADGCDTATVKTLIDANADITKSDNYGFTALHMAAWKGRNATVQLLAPLFAKAGLINAENKYGLTALMYAASTCDVVGVVDLLTSGADITKTDRDSWNALHYAAKNGKNSTVRFLIPLFAKAGLINAKSKHGLTALALAQIHCHEATVQALTKAAKEEEEEEEEEWCVIS